MTTTYESILGAHNVEIPAHLEAQAEVPVLSGPQRQGDVIILPTRPGQSAHKPLPVPPEGVAVVRGENNGNTHLLVADGPVMWTPTPTGGLTLGLLTVADGGTAFLLHPEHGLNAMGPGHYRITRQREQADVIRHVVD